MDGRWKEAFCEPFLDRKYKGRTSWLPHLRQGAESHVVEMHHHHPPHPTSPPTHHTLTQYTKATYEIFVCCSTSSSAPLKGTPPIPEVRAVTYRTTVFFQEFVTWFLGLEACVGQGT